MSSNSGPKDPSSNDGFRDPSSTSSDKYTNTEFSKSKTSTKFSGSGGSGFSDGSSSSLSDGKKEKYLKPKIPFSGIYQLLILLAIFTALWKLILPIFTSQTTSLLSDSVLGNLAQLLSDMSNFIFWLILLSIPYLWFYIKRK